MERWQKKVCGGKEVFSIALQPELKAFLFSRAWLRCRRLGRFCQISRFSRLLFSIIRRSYSHICTTQLESNPEYTRHAKLSLIVLELTAVKLGNIAKSGNTACCSSGKLVALSCAFRVHLRAAQLLFSCSVRAVRSGIVP